MRWAWIGFYSSALTWTSALLLCTAVVASYAELPSTPLPLLEGGSLNLQEFKGQVVVIRFLASW
ncbi:MAG TPA: hypothetical protein VJO34_04630 [Methylomirabilota bacterium]|nr:hypothetical protein [Methylomirabilota bacterium]